MGSELRSPGGADPPARSSAAAAAPAKSPDSFVRPAWVPASATLPVTPVEPGSACNLKEVMDMAGQRIREFVDNVQRFTATESLEHESINKSGDVTRSEKRIYDYVVSIDELRPGILDVEEYQTAKSARDSTPQDVINLGLPALLLVFHPYNWETFWMSCEGVATLNGRKVWQIYFRQREDQPNKIRSYKLGFNGPSYRVDLHGWAWFDLNSFQIIRLQADLIKAIPDIQLAVDHTSVEYGPVTFSSRKTEMWVPQTGEFFSERKGKRFHEHMSFSDYLLFAVDEKQKIADPKENP